MRLQTPEDEEFPKAVHFAFVGLGDDDLERTPRARSCGEGEEKMEKE